MLARVASLCDVWGVELCAAVAMIFWILYSRLARGGNGGNSRSPAIRHAHPSTHTTNCDS